MQDYILNELQITSVYHLQRITLPSEQEVLVQKCDILEDLKSQVLLMYQNLHILLSPFSFGGWGYD